MHCKSTDMAELIRDARIMRAQDHGWDVIQWSEDGTSAQLIRGSDPGFLFTIEIGLGFCRRFGRQQF